MAHQAKFDDSNIALLSSKMNHDVKSDVAKHADEWKGCGQSEGVEVWRIEKFKVHRWPKEQQGMFYDGDCYIVLSTKKDSANPNKFRRDIFFWLGLKSSQDEMGTAAYKTVELDDLFDGSASQHREVQSKESDAFKTLFPHLIYQSGGMESGFHHIGPENYQPRLLHVLGRRHPRVFDCPLNVSSLTMSDSFILDAGLKIWQWNGTRALPDEKREGHRIVMHLKEDRHSKPVTTILDGIENDEEFWKFFGGKPASIPEGDHAVHSEHREDKKVAADDVFLYKVSDRNPQNALGITEIAKGNAAKKTLLNSDDVFILDIGYQVFVYVGSKATKVEKVQAMQFADKYLLDKKKPSTTTVTKVIEGCHSVEFDQAFEF